MVEDGFVQKKIAQARYERYPCRRFEGSDAPEAIKVCFIPSMTEEFKHAHLASRSKMKDFKPTDFLLIMVRRLAAEIEEATKICMEEKLLSLGPSDFVTGRSQWTAAWRRIARKYLGFYVADQRPYVVYPENAAQAVHDICPQADFYVIILGDDVYKSISFDPKTDSYPSVNRMYVDIMDIKHAQTQADTRAIACLISERIGERMLKALTGP